jgi:hypothetical protein
MAHLGTKHPDTEDVQGLTSRVFSSHVDNAFKTKAGADSGCSYTVLASTCLGDDTRFSKTFGKESLRDWMSTTYSGVFSVATCPIVLLILCEPV